jgi:hypothetical protein
MTRGSLAAKKAIVKKAAKSRSKPVSVYKDGKFTATYPSVTAASKATGITVGNISNIALGKQKSLLGYSFKYVEVEDLSGEIWEPLPPAEKIPEWMFERRQTSKRPGKHWKGALASNMGRLKINGRVVLGSGVDYMYAFIDGLSWKIHILVALAHLPLEQWGVDYQVNHKDKDPRNNRLDNLEILSRQAHALITANQAPEAKLQRGITSSRLVKMTSSTTRPELVGQIKTTTEWYKLLELSLQTVANAVRLGHKAASQHNFAYVADELLDGEEEVEHQIYGKGGKLVSYKVTDFGRYWNKSAHKWINSEEVSLGGRKWKLWQLVLLAKTKDTSIPEGKEVDHIAGRDMDWPHKMSNLRWATNLENNMNRDFPMDHE